MSDKKRVFSGMRPTGCLHWGNYFGALKNWIELQNKHDCFYCIVDWHALTTGYEHPKEIKPSVFEVLKDWLAVGLDPKKAVIFIQSLVPEHAELHLLLSMITPLGWLERVPSFKDTQRELSDRDPNMYGFLGYPLLQTADIALYKADLIPVGEDQVAHIEFAREVVRRFNNLMHTDVLAEPKTILTKSARVPGLDGRKMSKSFNNAIYIADDEDTIRTKMMGAITDPARKRRSDPGHPDVCNIFAYHHLFSSPNLVSKISSECQSAQIGCVDCKKICIEKALDFWRPVRERRRSFDGRENDLPAIALEGASKAKGIAEQTMTEIRKCAGVSYE